MPALISLRAGVDEGGLESVVVDASAFGDVGGASCDAAVTLTFDPATVGLSDGTVDATLQTDTLRLALGLVRQGAGVGMTLDLVAAPYWAFVGLVWDVPGCCGDPGGASVVFFFGGEDELFDLGEIEFAVEWAVAASCTASVTLTTAGAAALTFGWEVAL